MLNNQSQLIIHGKSTKIMVYFHKNHQLIFNKLKMIINQIYLNRTRKTPYFNPNNQEFLIIKNSKLIVDFYSEILNKNNNKAY